MDILNWVYLLKNKLVKTTVQDPEKDLVILGNNVSWVKRGDKYQSYGITVTDFGNELLRGTDYIIVRAQGTPEENAQEFIAAYAEAVAADRDAQHRFTLVLAPGHYKFQETFLHNSGYINIISLTGQQDVIFDLELNGQDPFVAGLFTSSVMDININYTKVSGIKTQEYASANYVTWAFANYGNIESNYYPLPLNVIINQYTDLEVKNCTAGPFSFGADANFNANNDLEATFIDCTALGYSFGFGAFQIEADTVFTNCSGGNNSFYIDDDLRGTYTNCNAGNNSFYSVNDDIEGTFVNCTAGDFSFYTDDDDILGAFTNCTAGINSFYANDYISSSVVFTNCKAGNDSFWADGDNNEADYINCQAGANSFRAAFDNGANYFNCIGLAGSFSSDTAIYSMDNYYCLLYTTAFAGGTQYFSQDTL